MKKISWIVGCLLLVSLLIGTFFDYQIASFIFKKDNGFSYFFEHFAPVVFGSILIIAGNLVFIPLLKVEGVSKLKLSLFGVLGVLFCAFGILMIVVYGKLLGGVYAIIFIPIVFIMVRKIPVHLSKQYHFVGLAIILTAFTSMMIVENIKPIVGRVRFRSMQENPSLFTNWYQINGSKFLSSVPLKEEIKSFPSGHSQWAGTTLTLSLIALANPKWRNKEKLIFSGSLIYALTVMLSRMMQGAHFLSDVTVGFGTAFVCYLIFRKILVENKIEA